MVKLTVNFNKSKIITAMVKTINESIQPSYKVTSESNDVLAIVHETSSNYIYFTFKIETNIPTFIMETNYFSNDSKHLFTDIEYFCSLTIACSEIVRIIKTVNKANRLINQHISE